MQWINVHSFDPNKRVSKYHVLGEFIEDDFAYKENLLAQYTYRRDVENNITYLATRLLAPFEDIIGKPVCIYNGYMCNALQRAHGHKQSQLHTLGLAVDFQYPADMPTIERAVRSLQFQELFFFPSFVHLAMNFVYCARKVSDFRYEKPTWEPYH